MAINKAKRRKAEMTTRHGQLKVDRKAKPQKIFMDDLAIMENLTIVYTTMFFTIFQKQIVIYWNM